MAKRRHLDEHEALRPGWIEPREPLDEKPAATLNTPGAVYGWAAKASARSGPGYAPGVGQTKSS
jgi:hypothetical protein